MATFHPVKPFTAVEPIERPRPEPTAQPLTIAELGVTGARLPLESNLHGWSSKSANPLSFVQPDFLQDVPTPPDHVFTQAIRRTWVSAGGAPDHLVE